MSSEPLFRAEQIGDGCFRVVENDPYGQYPFLYVVLGADKCILIDTGTGTTRGGEGYREFVSKHINTDNLPFLVINTHVHFDHVGANSKFSGKDVQAICMGSGHQVFTRNYELNSLAAAHRTTVKPFEVSRWMDDGDIIYLDEKKREKETSLVVIHTPGHTPDSIALYSYKHKRLFVGDNVYPFTAIHLDSLGSSVKSYVESLHKIVDFLAAAKKEAEAEKSSASASSESSSSKSESGTAASASSSTESTSASQSKESATEVKALSSTATAPHPHAGVINEFLSIMGMTAAQAAQKFDIDGLLELSGYDSSNMVEFYFSNADDVPRLFPPKKKPVEAKAQQQAQAQKLVVKKMGPATTVRLSCGHVESDLEVEAVPELINLLLDIRQGKVQPFAVDSGYGEYTNGRFTVMLPVKAKWE